VFSSLQSRLLVAFGALIVALTAATLAYVSVLASGAVNDRITADLEAGRDALVSASAERGSRLALVAQLVASFPELRALLGTDAATVRDFLADYRQRQGRDELLLALDAGGQVIARSDSFGPLVLAEARARWLEPAATGRAVHGWLDVDGRAYQAVLAPAEAGGTIFGFILAGAPLDDAWARHLREASGKEVALLTAAGVAGSTLPPARLPWQRAADVPGPDGATQDVDLGGERFRAVATRLAVGEPTAVAVALQSLDLALAPYRRIQYGLLALGLVAAAAGVAGSAALARSITAPVAALTRAAGEVAGGNFDVRLAVQRDDELGRLGRAFNDMTAGLRERADMQKFVSQSTLAMIQREPSREARGGTREELTLLFADIRGFTAFAAGRDPAEAVAVLNRLLRIQADQVARFGGDVDKFIGDAVFAHFRGPDMALQAIRCALEIHRAVAAAAEGTGPLGTLAVGVGIATGEVIVGSIGSPDRLDYTAIGTPVNLAARLCAVAEPHETLLDARSMGLVAGLVAAEPVPPFAVKGVSAPVQAFRMRGQPGTP
jgi:class 3 adenylate cyclase